jgi:uncharacterized membrane protein
VEEAGVATLSVWRLDRALDADHAELTLKRLVEQDAITVHDAVFVLWPDGAKRPQSHPFRHDTASGAAGGSALGIFAGAVFTLPVVGLAVGAATGALRAHREHDHLDDEVLSRLGEIVTPGSAALFLLADVIDRAAVAQAFDRQQAELLYRASVVDDTEAGDDDAG